MKSLILSQYCTVRCTKFLPHFKALFFFQPVTLSELEHNLKSLQKANISEYLAPQLNYTDSLDAS